MSKAEKFISDCTKGCSNELIAFESRAGKEVISYNDWLTPDQARSAVGIAREEIYEWLNQKLSTYIDYRCRGVGEGVEEFVNDLKQAMKDE